MARHSFIFCILMLFSAALAASVPRQAELLHLGTYDHPDSPLERRAASSTSSSTSTSTSAVADSSCTNGAATRQCWGNGYSIATNYDAVWPNTGKTVSVTLNVQNLTLAPDGIPRVVYGINGQYPGPTVRANWGDILKITVTNQLTTNGTSMHWHGIRQYKSNAYDGANGITECPLAPGKSRTYTFLCTQFGTSWYHSHYSDQYADGVVGTIIIDGPTTSNYDYDLGTYPINDWFYTPVFTIAPAVEHGQGPPPPGDNILINGTNVNAQGGGAYARTFLTKGKKHKLRLINTSMQDTFQVGLDGHNMTVVTADFVPIVPYSTQYLTIGIGQRYDVIINANQAVDSYWFHAYPQAGCSNNKNKNALSIFTYSGASSTPSANSTANAAPPTSCVDNNAALVPYVKLNVPSNYTIPQSSRLDVSFAITANAGNQTLVQWNLNETAIFADWDKPTLQYVMQNNTNYPASANIIQLPQANQWSYWIIQAVANKAPPQPHPMHLHGHDFYVLGAGTGTYSNSSILNYNNPPRRDVAILPASGWLVLAFITDNPGAWLMHCHIAFHVSLGLGAQFLERVSDIPSVISSAQSDIQQVCTDWDAYYQSSLFKQTDSGL